jgi:hypothetical protein
MNAQAANKLEAPAGVPEVAAPFPRALRDACVRSTVGPPSTVACATMPGMGSDFEMIVWDVFVISGRGIVASGEAVHGEFRSGDVAQVWHGDQFLGQSVAFVELHVRPGTVAVILTDPTVHIQPSDHIKTTPR